MKQHIAFYYWTKELLKSAGTIIKANEILCFHFIQSKFYRIEVEEQTEFLQVLTSLILDFLTYFTFTQEKQFEWYE